MTRHCWQIGKEVGEQKDRVLLADWEGRWRTEWPGIASRLGRKVDNRMTRFCSQIVKEDGEQNDQSLLADWEGKWRKN